MEETIRNEPVKEFFEIRAKQAGFDIVFGKELLIGRINRRQACQELPHPRARFVQTKVALRFEIQKDGLFI